MFAWADSNWFRAAGYMVVATWCFFAIWRDDRESEGCWPPFWVLTGALFAAFGIARAADFADAVTNVLRERAVEEGWYASRRQVQALVVAGLGLAWLTTIVVACWRVPARRRRYLPMITIVLTLGAYAAIRAVSLHQIDSVLYRREAAGVRYGALIECALLFVACACAAWTPRRGQRPKGHHTDLRAVA